MRRVRSPALPEAEPRPEERAERLAREVDAAFAARGRVYWHMFATLREAFGAEAAERLVSAAVEAHGRAAGGRIFAGLAAATPIEVAAHFLRIASPDWGRLFAHEVWQDEDGRVEIRVLRCPLKDAWVADGRTEEEVATLCRIAGRADWGCFSAAPCAFSAETWTPGREGCCVLKLG
ncbi:MAG: L-2-amino-thiazoline-4-carboxylic acid hydrolase [Acetobacteraceae bacterium]|nr:L-2-amino-thiazoline-4-carboxylic acid hydrolase [Acetobacteraceae bacterium]